MLVIVITDYIYIYMSTYFRTTTQKEKIGKRHWEEKRERGSGKKRVSWEDTPGARRGRWEIRTPYYVTDTSLSSQRLAGKTVELAPDYTAVFFL